MKLIRNNAERISDSELALFQHWGLEYLFYAPQKDKLFILERVYTKEVIYWKATGLYHNPVLISDWDVYCTNPAVFTMTKKYIYLGVV